MVMRNERYWHERFEQVTEAQLKTGVDYYDEAERMYRKAMESIEKDIARWYMRLAKNNRITYAEAKKLLTNEQLEDFKMTLDEYIRRGKENGVSANWEKSLENASAKYHISRLEALKIQMQQHIEVLYGNQLDGMDSTMRNIYREGYYQTAYEMQKGFNTGFDVQQIDEARLERLLSKPWAADGQNFSQRLWSDKNKLINILQNELVQGIVRGDAQLKIVQSFAKRMNTSLSNAGRLIATESAYFAILGEKDSMKDLGVEQYEILATLDRKTSEICRSMDGKVFKMSEFKAGVTAPPFHPWCRSCTVPHIEGLDSGLRAARDDEGKAYYVPGNMKYGEWKEKFVGGGSKGGLQERKETNILDDSKVIGDVDVHFVGKIDKKMYSCITQDITTDEVIITETQIAHIKSRHPNDFERFSKYFEDIISEPDYIIKGNRPNSALILKEIADENKEKFKTVLRLITSSDDKNFKNSIITFMKIDDKEWKRLLKNKSVLYSRF